ncbi:MAG TPA: 2-oxoacid:acceptor oxidoreductase family protein, partial [Candidatus Eisenbacteria bacterium]|nr:2-oxoacid:acceptor oxidoreductase family protein [Candidatus Eisenbacteria bacterium]
MTLEIRLHGRGGQGGVTCAKILAAIYARLGKSVQTFGDYAGERSGAPVRAYTRVADQPITNRNKIYDPDHLLVLDPSLLGDDTVAGLAPGGLLLVNAPNPPADFNARFAAFRVATVDATAIARKHGIGTRSVVIVNTTIAGAYLRALDLPMEALEGAYRDLGLERNLDAAREAYAAVSLGAARPLTKAPHPATPPTHGSEVLPLTRHVESLPTQLKTGSWRTQLPRYVEHLAPCNAWCPAGNDVIGFIQTLLHQGAPAAAEVLGRTQPLASICGRVCPAPCMEGCNRRHHDGAVNIRSLERWVGDHATPAPLSVRSAASPRRIAVVGSGPAGLAAARELAVAGHKVTIFEGEEELGGVLRTGIPEYRLPREVVDREIQAILDTGVAARTGHFLDHDDLAALEAEQDAVILAAGFMRLTGLDVPGARLAGIEQGVRFLHRVNVGGGARLEGHVVVLGGGNTAMDCARSALRSGASSVTVAYRRTLEEMPAIREEIEEGRREGVLFLFQRQPIAFLGHLRVAAVEFAEVEMGAPDASGRKSPVVTDRVARVECRHVLLAIGQSADWSLLPPGSAIVAGRVRNAAGDTKIFAAGDFATGEGTVAHAIGDGRRAAGRVLASFGEEAAIFVRPDPAAAVSVEA